jgi:hypothetical protein
METTNIRYVGLKRFKVDNVAKTGISWAGPGDVQPVPRNAVARLLQHPDVWRMADEQAGLAEAPAPTPRFVLESTTGSHPLVLDTMTDAEVKDFAKAHGLPVDGRKKGDSLRQAVIDAVKAAEG